MKLVVKVAVSLRRHASLCLEGAPGTHEYFMDVQDSQPRSGPVPRRLSPWTTDDPEGPHSVPCPRGFAVRAVPEAESLPSPSSSRGSILSLFGYFVTRGQWLVNGLVSTLNDDPVLT